MAKGRIPSSVAMQMGSLCCRGKSRAACVQCGGTDRVSAAASLQCSILVPLSFVLLSYASCVVDQIMSDMKNDVINTECMFNAHYKEFIPPEGRWRGGAPLSRTLTN